MKLYKPETSFILGDRCVYSLRQDGWDKGTPRMVNDVFISITAHHLPVWQQKELQVVIQTALNNFYEPGE